MQVRSMVFGNYLFLGGRVDLGGDAFGLNHIYREPSHLIRISILIKINLPYWLCGLFFCGGHFETGTHVRCLERVVWGSGTVRKFKKYQKV